MQINNLKKVAVMSVLLKSAILKNAKKLTLSLTNKCNMRCKLCNIWAIYHKTPELKEHELTVDDHKKFFSENNMWDWIALTGGAIFKERFI